MKVLKKYVNKIVFLKLNLLKKMYLLKKMFIRFISENVDKIYWRKYKWDSLNKIYYIYAVSFRS